jgi:hypothetical protein
MADDDADRLVLAAGLIGWVLRKTSALNINRVAVLGRFQLLIIMGMTGESSTDAPR